ncbi:MAG: metallophosphoesterase [Solirubrobacterales bacterium]|nr:metallophosphoesterase [Solirubrobacterales bacterium]
MRTVVISDLHLGDTQERDVLRRPGPLAGLVAALAPGDRLVLLGDALELRFGPLRDALAVAAPVLSALGDAVGAEGELVLVPGNHDHALLDDWRSARAAAAQEAAPLTLAETLPVEGPALRRLAETVAPAPLRVAYPGLWLREDVYAIHGHYLDRLITIPTFERLGAGAMARVAGPLPADAAPEHFEEALAPMYAWMHAVAQSRRASWTAARQSSSASTWALLAGERHGSLRGRLTRVGFRAAVATLNRAGLGPVQAELSGVELRRAGLRAMGETVARLGVEAEHVVFGHTHRSGPLPDDDPGEWRGRSGARLHNAGCWKDEPSFAVGGPASPYYAGRVIVVDAEGPPRLERVVTELR